MQRDAFSYEHDTSICHLNSISYLADVETIWNEWVEEICEVTAMPHVTLPRLFQTLQLRNERFCWPYQNAFPYVKMFIPWEE